MGWTGGGKGPAELLVYSSSNMGSLQFHSYLYDGTMECRPCVCETFSKSKYRSLELRELILNTRWDKFSNFITKRRVYSSIKRIRPVDAFRGSLRRKLSHVITAVRVSAIVIVSARTRRRLPMCTTHLEAGEAVEMLHPV